MIRRALLAGLWLGLAACNQGASSTSFRLEQPSAVTVFRGFTARHAGLWPYAAVANTAQDELVMLDAVEDEVVAAPILLRPLSIPLPNPRPALLASARFTQPEGGPDRPDLLVAVSAGSTQLQLIRTWHDAATANDPRIATGPGLADEDPVDLGGQILAIIATPAVGSDGSDVADRVRVVAALAGSRIAVVEYAWSGNPADTTGKAARIAGPVFQDVVFDGLSLAVDPKHHSFLYAATLDSIDGVFGVAQLDMTRAVGSWPVQAIDAKAPTRLVAAFTLKERMLTAAGAYDQSTAPTAESGGPSAFQAEEKHRVYALRDPGACGPRTEVACGVAVLDPDPAKSDVLEDPWHPGLTPKRYLPPIAVPSTPVALVVGQPAKNPPPGDTNGLESSTLMLINPNAPRLTTGVLLMPSEDGRSYFADLARWETPSSTREIQSSVSGVGTSSFTPNGALLPRIGFYDPTGSGAPNFSTSAAFFLQLTPGFTPNDQWTITFQGYLPDFSASRAATIELLAGTPASTTPNTFLVSLQSTPPGASAPAQVVNVYDPAFGLHVGDIVEFWTDGSTTSDTPNCPDTSVDEAAIPPIEGKITEIRAPDAGHPGGSLVVVRGDCVPWAKGATTSCELLQRGPWTSIPAEECWNLLPNAGTVGPAHLGAPRQLRIRAGSGPGAPGGEEFVVVGAATGYAGRAVSTPTDPGNASKPTYALRNDGEATLVAGCQLIPYPAPGAAVPACDATCRATCERAWLARRARRIHLTSVSCPASTTSYCETYFPKFKLPTDANAPFEPPDGPALAFSLASEATELRPLVRDTHVSFSTRSGWTPASRWGGGGNSGPATQPTGGAWFDRTEDPAWNRPSERYRFFVPYVGNLVLDLSPAHGNDNTRVLR